MRTILLLAALTLLVPATVFGRGGKLSTLTIGFPDEAPVDARANVMNSLKNEFTLIEGSYINQFTMQTFAGTTTNLNELIRLLSISQFELKVVFADLKDNRVTFALSQNAGGAGESTITINTTSKDFKWADLKIQIPRPRETFGPSTPAKRPGADKGRE